MRANRSGQRDKVRRAREVVKTALGDAARRDDPLQPTPKDATLLTHAEQLQAESVLVLTVKEAATRLGISMSEMEAMVERGTVRSLMAGWTVVVPTSEVERIRSLRRS